MTNTTMTRQDLESALIQKCWKDPEFKHEIIRDPKGMLERYTGRSLPADLKITIHEEDAHTLHLSIPASPKNVAELSDEDLEKVAGGTDLVLAFAFGVATVGITVGAGGAAASLKASGIDPW